MKALQAEKEKANTKQKGNEKENKNAKGTIFYFRSEISLNFFFSRKCGR